MDFIGHAREVEAFYERQRKPELDAIHKQLGNLKRLPRR
jgi:hypothetical protein